MNIDNVLFFVLAQISAGVAITFTVISFFSKKQSKLFLFQIISNLFYMTNFILLGAYAGAIMLSIAIIRNITCYIMSIKKIDISVREIIIFESIYLVAGIVSFSYYADIFTIIANMLFTFGILQKNRITFLSCQIVASSFAVAYNLISLSYVGALLELIAIISGFIAIIAIVKKAKKSDDTTNKYDFS